MRASPREEEEGIALTDWVKAVGLGDFWIHITNEGKRSPRQGSRLVRQGLLKGAADYFLSVPRGEFHGFYLELKPRNGLHPTAHQIDFLERMRTQMYATAWAAGWEEGAAMLVKYLDNNWTNGPLNGVIPNAHNILAQGHRRHGLFHPRL